MSSPDCVEGLGTIRPIGNPVLLATEALQIMVGIRDRRGCGAERRF